MVDGVMNRRVGCEEGGQIDGEEQRRDERGKDGGGGRGCQAEK